MTESTTLIPLQQRHLCKGSEFISKRVKHKKQQKKLHTHLVSTAPEVFVLDGNHKRSGTSLVRLLDFLKTGFTRAGGAVVTSYGLVMFRLHQLFHSINCEFVPPINTQQKDIPM